MQNLGGSLYMRRKRNGATRYYFRSSKRRKNDAGQRIEKWIALGSNADEARSVARRMREDIARVRLH